MGPTNIAGRILSLAFDPVTPSHLYAGAAGGGVWESTDDGATWTPRGDALPSMAIGALAVSAHDPNVLIAGTGDPSVIVNSINGVGILRSTDGGKTWSPTNVVEDFFVPVNGYNSIVANPRTGIILAAGRNGLWRSTDDGASWSSVVSDGHWTDVQWRPGGADSAFAIREFGGVFVSADSGRTFSQVTAGLPSPTSIGGLGRIGCSASRPEVVYAALCAADSTTLLGIYRSTDGGATWELRASSPDLFSQDGFVTSSILVDRNDPDQVLVGGVFLYRSFDGGATWHLIETRETDGYFVAGFHVLAGSITGRVWMGTDVGVYLTADGGKLLLGRNQGLVTTEFNAICGGDPLYGALMDNGFLRRDNPTDWTRTEFGLSATECQCDPRNGPHAYGMLGWGYPLVSWDGMEHNDIIEGGLHGTRRWATPLALDPSDSERLFLATHDGIFRTVNGGALWSLVGPASDVVSIAVSPVTPRWIWALERSSGQVHVSRDGGDSWTTSQAAPLSLIGGMKILADPADSMTAFCTFLHHVGHGPIVLRTTDGGATWQDVSGDLGEQSVNTIAVSPYEPLEWYVGTDSGVWASRDGGQSWKRYGEGLPMAQVSDLEIESFLYAATHGRGVWRVPLQQPGLATRSTLGEIRLQVIGSNPARGSAVFRVISRSREDTVLRIFDTRGRLVATVATVPGDGSARVISWHTSQVATGIYIAELRSGWSRARLKIAVVR